MLNERPILSFLKQREPLLLVLGEKGAGKSELVRKLNHKQLLPSDTLYLKGKSILTPAKLVKALSHYWHVTLSHSRSFTQQLDELLSVLVHRLHPACLIIDDAANLSIAALAALMHLSLSQSQDRLGLRIILLGRPALECRIHALHHPDVKITCIRLSLPRRKVPSQALPALLHQEALSFTQRLSQHWIKIMSVVLLGFSFLGIHQYQLKMQQVTQLAQGAAPAHPVKRDVSQTVLPSLAHYLPSVVARAFS